jgi:copper(I)-binding protein
LKTTIILILLITSLLAATYKSVAQSQQTEAHDKLHGKNHNTSKQEMEKKLVIHNPTVKTTPPGIANSVGYFHITNHSDKDITLINVNSDIADRTEIHQHTMANGLMKMQKIDTLVMPAKSTINFEPGSYHIMFINVNQAIVEKQQVELTLSFSDGSSQIIMALAEEKKWTQGNKH